MKPCGSELLPMSRVAFVPDRVDRADRFGDAVALGDEPVRGFLVRDGDVAADVAVVGEMREEVGERLGRSVDELVAARDAQLREPVAVNHRRARMRDRVAHHAGAPYGTVHDATFRAFMFGG